MGIGRKLFENNQTRPNTAGRGCDAECVGTDNSKTRNEIRTLLFLFDLPEEKHVRPVSVAFSASSGHPPPPIMSASTTKGRCLRTDVDAVKQSRKNKRDTSKTEKKSL
jgi:hypothetical protein